jgi:crotonobetainyl-CoA:carnitine CoA-transferase CaiB-like acyl-CoA transferase
VAILYASFKSHDSATVLQQFRRMAQSMGHPEWADDPSFVTNIERVKNKAKLVSVMTELLMSNTTSFWRERFMGKG